MKKRIFILMTFILLMVFTSCNTAQQKPMRTDESSMYQMNDIKNVRIITDNLNVRTGAGSNFPVLDKVKRNQILNVVGETGDWYVVRLPDNRVGCVDSDYAKPIVVEGQQNQDRTEQPQQTEQPEATEQPQQGQQRQQQRNAQQETRNQPNQVTRLSQNEERLLNLVNEERTRRNLKPLSIDLELTRVARLKSQDMENKNYFSHYSPTYGSPFDMMKTYGIEYVSAAENIAGNPSIDNAHNSLMNSEGHRKNILNPEFTHIGIGITRSDRYGYLITQMFISKPR